MERRIVLLGKTGSGKSASGNTILKGTYFEKKSAPVPVTHTCSMKEVGRIRVIDTPDMFGTSLSQSQLKHEMDLCINMSVPGPHVFLLVIRLGRFTEEEKNAVKWIQEKFSEDAFLYTIVLFTHTDQLGKKTLEEFLAESLEMRRLLTKCGNRYHGFSNNDPSPAQVDSLMEKIEDMVKMNKGRCYTEEMYQKAQRRWQNDEIMGVAAAVGVVALGAAAIVAMGLEKK